MGRPKAGPEGAAGDDSGPVRSRRLPASPPLLPASPPRADHGCAEPLERGAQALGVDIRECGRDPLAVRLGERGRGALSTVGAANPALLEDEAADATPAIMRVDALDDHRREMLELEGESAFHLDPKHGGFGPRVPVDARAPRPVDPDRLRRARKALSHDLRPSADDVRRRKALRRERGSEARAHEVGERLR